MGADILPGRNRRARRRRRTSLRFAQSVERQITENRQRPDGDTGALEEGAAILANAGARPLRGGGPSTNSMTFRPLDQHGCRPLSAWIRVDAIKVANLGRIRLIACLQLV